MSRVITVTSGKGGVGKTNISVNLALYFANEGYSTCLFDADIGLANADIVLGIHPELSLENVIFEKKKMSDILVKDHMGIDIVPGSSGIQRMADLKPEELDLLTNALSELENYDFLIIDTSAGISKNVVSFCMASPEIIIVVTPEPTSLTDAYSLLKILSVNGFKGSAMVAVNQCKNLQVSGLVFSKFKSTVEKYLPLKIMPLGTILVDDHVLDAVKKQKPFISLHPNSNASKGIKNIGRYLVKQDKPEFAEYGVKSFWPKCFKLFTDSLQLTVPKAFRMNQVPGNVVKENSEYSSQKADKENEKLQISCNPLSLPEDLPANQKTYNSEVYHQDIILILEKFSKDISNISSELGTIRELMEKCFLNLPRNTNS